MVGMVALAPSSEALHKPETCARAQGSYANSDARGTLKSSTARDLATATCTEHIRWVSCSRDPIGYDAGSNCLFEYCHSKPFIYADPWGKQIMVTIPPGRNPQTPHQPTDPLKPGWPVFPTPPLQDLFPSLPPASAEDYSSCDGYNLTIGQTCRKYICGDRYIDVPDEYPARAKGVCKDFLELYGFSRVVKCVAKCLGEQERTTQGWSSCETRNKERLEDHVYCYASCGFLPYKGLPPDGPSVGWGIVLPGWWDHHFGGEW